MTAEPKVRFFLGANSPGGFYPLRGQLIAPARMETVFLLKGGPGCGKSSLMGRVAATLAGHGLDIEYIQCSGDPDSLDAIHIPALKAAIADATAPHALEPKCPGAVERYVDLGQFYDFPALKAEKEAILTATAAYQACHSRATRCLCAAAQIQEDARALLLTPTLEAKLAKRARGILSREVKKTGSQPGTAIQRFLGSPTWQGRICNYDTADLLCRRIYELSDTYGLGHALLEQLAAGVLAAGYDVILCPAPMAPDRLEHLLIPALSLGFLSVSPELPYGKRPYRRIRVDAMADPALLREHRGRLKFARRVTGALLDEAVASLAQAKEGHDALEALYNPHVDFAGVYRTADAIAAELLEQAGLPQE